MYKIIKCSICLMWLALFSFLCFNPKQTEFKLNETPKSQKLNAAAVDDTFTLNADQLASWGVTSGSITFTITAVGKVNTVAITDAKTNLVEANDFIIPDTVIYNDVEYWITDIGVLGGEKRITVTGELKLPAALTELAENAFAWVNFTGELIIPSHVKSVGWRAFFRCGFFDTLTIKDNNTLIDYLAFSGCDSLTKINLPFTKWSSENKNCFSSLAPTTGLTRSIVVPKGSKITLDQLGLANSNWTMEYVGSDNSGSNKLWMYIVIPGGAGVLLAAGIYIIIKRKKGKGKAKAVNNKNKSKKTKNKIKKIVRSKTKKAPAKKKAKRK
ncbi:MAG: leucine-rich repeat domain-containing protein [Mycoplasmataceae bacterium]|nr:leucine-rich repeat domain-containing protein [Mycoplasmataceae bacterium]